MKNRKPTDNEILLIKKFFTNDMINSVFHTDELDAMVFSNEIFESENTDFIIYDITDNIKFLIIVTIELDVDAFFKTVDQFTINIETEELISTKEIDFL